MLDAYMQVVRCYRRIASISNCVSQLYYRNSAPSKLHADRIVGYSDDALKENIKSIDTDDTLPPFIQNYDYISDSDLSDAEEENLVNNTVPPESTVSVEGRSYNTRSMSDFDHSL
jgi:hypothetical protein